MNIYGGIIYGVMKKMLKRNNSSIIIIIRHPVSITNTLSQPLNNRYLLDEKISSYKRADGCVCVQKVVWGKIEFPICVIHALRWIIVFFIYFLWTFTTLKYVYIIYCDDDDFIVNISSRLFYTKNKYSRDIFLRD